MKLALAGALLCALVGAGALHAQPPYDLGALQQRSEAGDRKATRTLAEAYYLGRGGVQQDFAQAARWYRRLAAQGDAPAQTSLGLMYARGIGVDKDMTEARKWWSLAAAQNDPGAQHNLGMVFLEGQGVAPDPSHALHWLRRAAARGHVLAQRIAGLMYIEGNGTERDALTGAVWLVIAAERGDEGAQEALKTLSPRIGAETLSQARSRAAPWLAKYSQQR